MNQSNLSFNKGEGELVQMSLDNPFARAEMPGGFSNNPKKEMLSTGSEDHSSFMFVYPC